MISFFLVFVSTITIFRVNIDLKNISNDTATLYITRTPSFLNLPYLGDWVHEVAGNAEIAHLDLAGARDEDVAGLHITVDDAQARVQVVQRAHHAVRN